MSVYSVKNLLAIKKLTCGLGILVYKFQVSLTDMQNDKYETLIKT